MQHTDPHFPYSFYFKPPPHPQFYYAPFQTPTMPQQFNQPGFFNYPYILQRQGPPIQQFQEQFKKPSEPIVISDDEQPKPEPKKQTKLLDLDQLESQKQIYDQESSESPLVAKRATRNARYDLYESPKIIKKKVNKVRYNPPKKEVVALVQKIKPARLGSQLQQDDPSMSAVQTRLIRIYQKDDRFEQLFENLKQFYPECNDEDVARVLNIAGKDYDRANQLVQESDLLIKYYFQSTQTYFSKKELSDDDSTFCKK